MLNSCTVVIRWWLSVSLFLVIDLTSFFESLFSYDSVCSCYCSFCSFDSMLFSSAIDCALLSAVDYALFALCSAEWDFRGSSNRRRLSSSSLCSISIIWLCLFRLLRFITDSSDCDDVSVLCLLMSSPPILFCCSLLLRDSFLASPTSLLNSRHFVVADSRKMSGSHRFVVYNNVICCLWGSVSLSHNDLCVSRLTDCGHLHYVKVFTASSDST